MLPVGWLTAGDWGAGVGWGRGEQHQGAVGTRSSPKLNMGSVRVRACAQSRLGARESSSVGVCGALSQSLRFRGPRVRLRYVTVTLRKTEIFFFNFYLIIYVLIRTRSPTSVCFFPRVPQSRKLESESGKRKRKPFAVSSSRTLKESKKKIKWGKVGKKTVQLAEDERGRKKRSFVFAWRGWQKSTEQPPLID